MIGKIMGRLFGDGDTVEVDAYLIKREEKYLPRKNPDEGGDFKSKTYTVTNK